MSDNEDDKTLLQQMHRDMRDMKFAMSQMAEAITRLAVLEEKHLGVATSLQRETERIDSLSTEIHNLQIAFAAAQGQAKGAGWVIKAIWGAVAAIVLTGLGLVVSSIFGAPKL